MNIDTSSLSEGQKATAEFAHKYAGMMHQLNGPGFIPRLCAHEAAHVGYYQLMGCKQFRARPPAIFADARTGKLTGHLAAVEIIDKPEWFEESWQDWVSAMARACVAGSVVARQMGSTDDEGGEEGDRRVFDFLCAELMAHFKNIKVDTDEEWNNAKRSVENDLVAFPEIMNKIHAQAVELRSQFGFEK